MINAYWGLVEDQLARMQDKQFQESLRRFLKLWTNEYQRRHHTLPSEASLLRCIIECLNNASSNQDEPPGKRPQQQVFSIKTAQNHY